MTTISERLNEWRKLADAATEGPWRVSGLYIDALWATSDSARHIAQFIDASAHDELFIVASREAVPKLLDAVEKVLELCDNAEQSNPFGREQWNADIRAILNEALGVDA